MTTIQYLTRMWSDAGRTSGDGQWVWIEADDGVLLCFSKDEYSRHIIRIAMKPKPDLDIRTFVDFAKDKLKDMGGYIIDPNMRDYWDHVKPNLLWSIYGDPEVHSDGETFDVRFTQLRVGEKAVDVTRCTVCGESMPMEWAYSYNQQACSECSALQKDEQLSML